MPGVGTQLASALCCFQEGFSLLSLGRFCSDGSARMAWGQDPVLQQSVCMGQPCGLGAWGGEVLGLSSAPRSTVLAEEEREVPKARQQCDTFPASLSSTSLDIPPTHIEI